MEKIYIALYNGGLGEELVNGLISKLKEGILWVGDKILNGLGSGLIGLTPVFAGACMIGVFLTIAGEKKIGTKISSLSIVIYLLLKVILHA